MNGGKQGRTTQRQISSVSIVERNVQAEEEPMRRLTSRTETRHRTRMQHGGVTGGRQMPHPLLCDREVRRVPSLITDDSNERNKQDMTPFGHLMWAGHF